MHLPSRLLDRALAVSCARAGAFGVRYTERQLFFELCRTLMPLPELARRNRRRALLLPLLGLAALPHRAATARWTALGLAAAGGAWLARALPYTLHAPLDGAQFAAALGRRRAHFGNPPGLLPPAAAPWLADDDTAPDLYAYGLPRLLLCQDAAIARMLLENWLHMELGCAILPLEAHAPLPEPVRAMLTRSRRATVFVLHDAGAAGLELTRGLRGRLGLPPAVVLAPLGLRPLHARQMHLFATRSAPVAPRPLPPWLTPDERAWLAAGRQAEVAAISPPRLLRTLRRFITGSAAVPPVRFRAMRAAGFMDTPGA